jgi:hypothetical protein
MTFDEAILWVVRQKLNSEKPINEQELNEVEHAFFGPSFENIGLKYPIENRIKKVRQKILL